MHYILIKRHDHYNAMEATRFAIIAIFLVGFFLRNYHSRINDTLYIEC